jgi:hypothetical protein
MQHHLLAVPVVDTASRAVRAGERVDLVVTVEAQLHGIDVGDVLGARRVEIDDDAFEAGAAFVQAAAQTNPIQTVRVIRSSRESRCCDSKNRT